MTFWQHVLDRLQDNQRVYVLTVIENHGSSPGRKGFKMMVAQDGFIIGSIGGGVMEFALVEEAQQWLKNEDPPTFVKKQVHKGHIKDGSGMICSGEQTVSFHSLHAAHTHTIQRILACLHSGNKGTLHLTQASFRFSTKHLENQFEYQINTNEDWFFNEHIGFRETLYIIGGGHVSVAVSELFVKLGFYVVVFDNRTDLNTLVDNNFAHQKHVVDYNNISDHVQQGEHSYVVVMTNKYREDKLVVSKLVDSTFKFIGVLGSKAKIKTLWKDLVKEGISKSALISIHAPIGLSIKSETPAEIAVSIAAQIIQVKNNDSNQSA